MVAFELNVIIWKVENVSHVRRSGEAKVYGLRVAHRSEVPRAKETMEMSVWRDTVSSSFIFYPPLPPSMYASSQACRYAVLSGHLA